MNCPDVHFKAAYSIMLAVIEGGENDTERPMGSGLWGDQPGIGTAFDAIK